MGLLDFAYFRRELALDSLVELAAPEDWSSIEDNPDHNHPMLYFYLLNTFKRVDEQDKIQYSSNGRSACFNTGLRTSQGRHIIAYFVENRIPNKQEWFFLKWILDGAPELAEFSSIPEPATYVTDPAELQYPRGAPIAADETKLFEDLQSLLEGPAYTEERRARLSHFAGLPVAQLREMISTSLERARNSQVKPVPQWFFGHIQFLIPLRLGDQFQADFAIALRKEGDPRPGRDAVTLRAVGLLTLAQGYTNARLLKKPAHDWIHPSSGKKLRAAPTQTFEAVRESLGKAMEVVDKEYTEAAGPDYAAEVYLKMVNDILGHIDRAFDSLRRDLYDWKTILIAFLSAGIPIASFLLTQWTYSLAQLPLAGLAMLCTWRRVSDKRKIYRRLLLKIDPDRKRLESERDLCTCKSDPEERVRCLEGLRDEIQDLYDFVDRYLVSPLAQ